MSFKTLPILEIARAIGAQVEGDDTLVLRGPGALDSAGPGEITFAADARRAQQLRDTKASAAIVPMETPAAPGLTLLRCGDPEAAFAAVLGLFAPAEDFPAPGVHPSACIAPDAQIAPGAAIGPNVTVGAGALIAEGVVLCANVSVGRDAVIGEGSVLFPGVVVRERCRVGRRCRLHANSVIGADGFGYFFRQGQHHKVPHIGTVEIGDDVEIGACSCIDRAKFGVTRIGDGTKIDNLVQVAHNVQVGRGVLLVSQVGVAGSARLGDYVVLGGHVGVRDNISVGPGLQAAAFSALAQDMDGNQLVSGIPAMPAKEHYRALQVYAKLPELKKQLKELQARLDALEQPSKNDRA